MLKVQLIKFFLNLRILFSHFLPKQLSSDNKPLSISSLCFHSPTFSNFGNISSLNRILIRPKEKLQVLAGTFSASVVLSTGRFVAHRAWYRQPTPMIHSNSALGLLWYPVSFKDAQIKRNCSELKVMASMPQIMATDFTI